MAYRDNTIVPLRHFGRMQYRHVGIREYVRPSVVVSGTAVASGVLESAIVTGDETIILTLTNGRWIEAGTAFNAVRQAIIDGLDSAGEEATGWNAEVRDKEAVSAVVRTDDVTVTITLSASASYAIDADETITVTVPATAVDYLDDALTGSPTITVTAEAEG
jgi:hypothetical protein